MHLLFCYNEFWIYLHICSLFKSILLYRVNKIMFTAIPILFPGLKITAGQRTIFRPDRRLDRSNSRLAGHFDRSFLDACRLMRFAL